MLKCNSFVLTQDLTTEEIVANIKSQKKRNKTNEKSRMRNRAVKSELKTATRRVREAVEEGNGAAAYAAALAACRLMDKAVTKGVIHKNQAANRKSGVMKLANSIAAGAAAVAEAAVDLEKMTVADLKAFAAEKAIELKGATKKADIIAAIKAAL